MQLFQLLQALDGELAPARCKIHLAGSDGTDDPLDVYLKGDFDKWQSYQTKRNFGREFVISLISMRQANLWLFAGAHDSLSYTEEGGLYHYQMQRRTGPNELDGRLVVKFQRPGRQSYLNADAWSDDLEVVQLRAERLGVIPFPGYTWVTIAKSQLDLIVRNEPESWRTALGAVKGVYVITDGKTGKQYVGSATGAGGIWGRWAVYSTTGHGNNKELIELLRLKGEAYAEYFQFGILETADSHAVEEYVRDREAYWKRMLQSVKFGYNSN